MTARRKALAAGGPRDLWPADIAMVTGGGGAALLTCGADAHKWLGEKTTSTAA